MKKSKRCRDYHLSLEILNDHFVRPPRDSQRNWILNRLLKEAGEDLESLHGAAANFVPGAEPEGISERRQGELEDDEIMEDWQIKVMKEMAREVCRSHGDVLEIGFGRGISADFIQVEGVRSHTIVECDDSVIRRYEEWKQRQKKGGDEIRLIRGKWQDTVDRFRLYDGIFFHTYPLDEEEFANYVARSSTFAEHFFDTASTHLKEGGSFTYLTNEINSLSRSHQRALFKRFRSFTLRQVKDLGVPDDTRDAQWSQETVVVRAEK